MPQNFYEMLGVEVEATMHDIQLAYKRKLGRLVRRKREAEKSGAPLGVLEREERDLREAIEVLTNKQRKLRYDAFRLASEERFPTQISELWELIQDSAMDPTHGEALQLLDSLTKLPLSEIIRRKNPPEDMTEQFSVDEDSIKTAPRIIVDLKKGIQVPKEVSKPALERMPRSSTSKIPQKDAPKNENNQNSQNNATNENSAKHSKEEPAQINLPPKTAKPRFTVEELGKQYGYGGAFLRAVRESKSISIHELSHTIKVKPAIINAIEQENFSRLQSAPYVKGHLKALVSALGIRNYRTIVIDEYIKRINKQRN